LNPSLKEPKLHVAVIMDGNGRWATARGMPRFAGHRKGVETVRRIVEAAPDLGIGVLTLYAFSSDNWRRPAREVSMLMRLFRTHLRSETPRLLEQGVRVTVIGRRDRLSLALLSEIDATEAATADGATLHLRLAIDYSSRDSILRAAQRVTGQEDVTREAFSRLLVDEHDTGDDAPDVDLLVRTGGERRLSDFLLWESAYAELYFSDLMWPEFTADDLEAAVTYFHTRERRFGALPEAAAG
jgi:undecaprenyl diphosphate synthase